MEDLEMQKCPKNTDLKHPLLLIHHDERARRLQQLPVSMWTYIHEAHNKKGCWIQTQKCLKTHTNVLLCALHWSCFNPKAYCIILRQIYKASKLSIKSVVLMHMLQVLDGFDAIIIEADIMKQSHVWTNLMSRHTESAIDRLTRSQELLHFCTDSEEERQWITVFTLTYPVLPKVNS